MQARLSLHCELTYDVHVCNVQLCTETKEKADISNQQFQSVFTPLSPLSLQDLSLMKVQDLVDDKVIPPTELSDDLRTQPQY